MLVQYPRQGAWTIAFVTGRPGGEVAQHLGSEHLSIYVPTTPNPTSGFFLMVARSEVVPLRMSVDAALKYVISMGVVAPDAPPPRPPGAPRRRAAKSGRLTASQAHSTYLALRGRAAALPRTAKDERTRA